MTRVSNAASPETAQKYLSQTYMRLRLTLAAIGFVLPLLLWLGGWYRGKLPLAGSISAYYYEGDGLMRDWFVGGLFAIGILLFAYAGVTAWENWALNIGGVLIICVALFPMKWPSESANSSFSPHGIFAVCFFICIGYVCIFRAKDTLTEIRDQKKLYWRYRRCYQILGWLMVASPVIAFLLGATVGAPESLIFFVELVGVYVFSAFWVVKTYEIARASHADKVALEGKLDVRRPNPL